MTLILRESDLIDLNIVTDGDEYWYLASPYSSLDKAEAFVSAAFAAAWLIGNGVRVYSPITHSHPIAHYGGLDPLDLDLWLRVDRPFMQNACGMIVLQLPGWRESKGILFEQHEFTAAKKPIHCMAWPIA
jgi:hypothetical protein